VLHGLANDKKKEQIIIKKWKIWKHCKILKQYKNGVIVA
jgi:hypothetical protein